MDVLKSVSKATGIFGKISEVIGELGGWMSILGLGKHVSAGGGAEAGLKASFMGTGENDEALFWSAVSLAKQNGWIDADGLKTISTIFSQLNHEERNRLYKIIGRDEQNVVIEVHSKTTPAKVATPPPAIPIEKRRRGGGSGATASGNTGSTEEVKKTSATSNVRGALTIALLASMDPADAVAFLRNSGTLSGIMDDVGYRYGQLSGFLKKHSAGKHLRKAILAYLGATTDRGAEMTVLMGEALLEDRQRQNWWQRDLQHRRPLLITWGVFIAIAVVTLSYTFTA